MLLSEMDCSLSSEELETRDSWVRKKLNVDFSLVRSAISIIKSETGELSDLSKAELDAYLNFCLDDFNETFVRSIIRKIRSGEINSDHISQDEFDDFKFVLQESRFVIPVPANEVRTIDEYGYIFSASHGEKYEACKNVLLMMFIRLGYTDMLSIGKYSNENTVYTYFHFL